LSSKRGEDKSPKNEQEWGLASIVSMSKEFVREPPPADIGGEREGRMKGETSQVICKTAYPTKKEITKGQGISGPGNSKQRREWEGSFQGANDTSVKAYGVAKIVP